MARLTKGTVGVRLGAMLLFGAPIIGIDSHAALSFAQCAGYSVEVLSGPDCQILPSFATAWGIAENGAISGGYVDCSEVGHHVIWWPDGSWTELPPSEDGGIPDSPFAINSAGQVAGRMHVPGVNPPQRAFFYSEGVTLNLGTLPGGNKSEALGISESGAICGYSTGIGQPLQAFVWQDGTMSALQLPYGTDSVANDVSNSGLICGWMGVAPHIDGHAFIYDVANEKVIDAGIQLDGAVGSQARGVNNSGEICGSSTIPCGELCNVLRGFIWSTGTVEDLGVLPTKVHTRPFAINDANVIVGYCDPGGATAFVWHTGTMTAINDLISPKLNLNITVAWDINNTGQIVGEALVVGTADRVAVRLTPIPSPIGDSDCDDDVDVDDLLKVINTWGAQSPKGSSALPPADFNHDSIVNLPDLLIVIDNWTL